MPIVGPGETANDHYVEQLVDSAQAAIDKVVDMGVGDRNRIGVGGHSYGGFMTCWLSARNSSQARSPSTGATSPWRSWGSWSPTRRTT